MSQSSLFSYGDVKNHPRRSGFDLSARVNFTAKAGELLPVKWRLVHPGDSFRLSCRHFTRTMPVNTAAYTRIREYFDWYFVPLRLLNKNIGQALVDMVDNPVQAQSLTESKDIILDLPYTNLSSLSAAVTAALSSDGSFVYEPADGCILNQFGFYAGSCSYKLIDYLNYGAVFSSNVPPEGATLGYYSNKHNEFVRAVNLNVNIIPFLSYQKIYADHHRFPQWEKNEPYTYNVDYYNGGNILSSISGNTAWREYLSSNNIFTLRYANYPKDMFMGVLPDSQLGSVSTVQISSESESVVKIKNDLGPDHDIFVKSPFSANTPLELESSDSNSQMDVPHSLIVSSPLFSDFSILQLRMAEAVQKYREVQQCADPDYKSQIEAHFNVKLSDALSDRCHWIGGYSSNMDITEVVNTTLVEQFGADIRGKGVGSGQGFEQFTANEYGVIMLIYHAQPVLEYNIMAPWKELLYTTTTDIPKPEFDSIGMESLPVILLSNSKESYGNVVGNVSINSILGYVPRFIELKTDIDRVKGAFTSTLSSWVAALDPNYLSEWFKASIYPNDTVQLNYNFFKVNPAILDSIFVNKVDSTCDTDQFLVSCFCDITAVRNFDYDGMPY